MNQEPQCDTYLECWPHWKFDFCIFYSSTSTESRNASEKFWCHVFSSSYCNLVSRLAAFWRPHTLDICIIPGEFVELQRLWWNKLEMSLRRVQTGRFTQSWWKASPSWYYCLLGYHAVKFAAEVQTYFSSVFTSKRWFICIKRHGVTFQTTIIFVVTAVRTASYTFIIFQCETKKLRAWYIVMVGAGSNVCRPTALMSAAWQHDKAELCWSNLTPKSVFFRWKIAKGD